MRTRAITTARPTATKRLVIFSPPLDQHCSCELESGRTSEKREAAFRIRFNSDYVAGRKNGWIKMGARRLRTADSRGRSRMKLDIVTLEVVRNVLPAIANEKVWRRIRDNIRFRTGIYN